MNNYLKIDCSTINAGITHQINNLKTLIKYSVKHDKKLIKPLFKLTGLHNNGYEITSNLEEYFDFDNIIVDGGRIPFKLYDDIKDLPCTISRKGYKSGLLKNDIMFDDCEDISVFIPLNRSIVEYANTIKNIIGDNYMCIHVRRGDRNISDEIDINTQYNNIMNVILEHQAKNVYIMTNKIDEIGICYDNPMFKIMTFNDFNILTEIEQQDNYKLFLIEKLLMSYANIRCSTFNTKLLNEQFEYTYISSPPNPFYHCCLCKNISGKQ